MPTPYTVALLYVGEDRDRSAGGGVLVGPRRVLTCAHVLTDAAGTQYPHEAAFPVAFRTPGGNRLRRTGRLSLWLPPDGSARGDLAVLDLDEPVPADLSPAAWADLRRGQHVRARHAGGAVETLLDATVTVWEPDDERAYMDGAPTGPDVLPGYSGCPVTLSDSGAVVGLVVAAREPPPGTAYGDRVVKRRSRILPWQVIRRLLPADMLGESLANAARTPEQDDLLRFLAPLEPLLSDAATARLAAELGCGERCLTASEVKALVLAQPRALATLSESLTAAPGDLRDELTRVLTFAGCHGLAALLSVAEHRSLTAMLTDVVTADATVVRRAARAALPLIELPAMFHRPRLTTTDVAAVVDACERMALHADPTDQRPLVPALLTLVEFVAASAAEPQQSALHRWCATVAKRIGVPVAAMRERRADAQVWAASAAAPPPLVWVDLHTAPTLPDHYECRIWHVGGADGPVAAPVPLSGPLTAQQVAACIDDAVTALRCEPGQDASAPPRVTIALGLDALHLPVDEWCPDDYDAWVPALPIGVQHHVSVCCPEMSSERRIRSRSADQKRRWANAASQTRLHVSPTDSAAHLALALRGRDHEDTPCVVIDAVRERHHELVAVCLALGVPVVLWDRAAVAHESLGRLGEPHFPPESPLNDLHVQVRDFRHKAHGDRDTHPARPTLVWEERDHHPPTTLLLTDPGTEGRSAS